MEGKTPDESWEGYMEMEWAQLQQRASGKMSRALGHPVPGETQDEIDRIAEDDRLEARQGLVRLMGEDGGEYLLHVYELTRENRPDRK